MTYILEISPEAELGINKAESYHKNRDVTEGSDLLELIADKLELIETNPFLYQVRYRDWRAAPIKLRRFKYHLIYRIASSALPTIHILEFVSQSSNWLPAE